MGTAASAQVAKAYESKAADDVKAALAAMDDEGKKKAAEVLGIEELSEEGVVKALEALDDDGKKKDP